MNKKKKIILIVLLVILIIALLIGIGFLCLLFSLQNQGPLFEMDITVDPEPLRDFIVDSFESILPSN